MIAAENQSVTRTVGDTDPIAFELSVRGATTSKVVETAVVTMHVKATAIIDIVGVAQGTGKGVFSFPASALAGVAAGTYDYEIEVVDGVLTYTHTRGKLTMKPQIK